METGSRARIASYAMVVAFSLLLFLAGVQLPGYVMKLLSLLPLVLTGLFAVYDYWAWRWPGLVNFARRPWLGGTWRGTLTSYRRDETTATPIKSQHDVVLTIEQTFTTIRLVLMTAESKSRSFAAEFVRHGGESPLLSPPVFRVGFICSGFS